MTTLLIIKAWLVREVRCYPYKIDYVGSSPTPGTNKKYILGVTQSGQSTDFGSREPNWISQVRILPPRPQNKLPRDAAGVATSPSN